jgi:glycosyltransferase involved in cell wall biosynthesis
MLDETKPLCIVRAPCETRSGYGDMSRDIIRHIIEYDKFDVRVHSVNWGETPMNALNEDNPRDKMILDRIREPINKQPDLFVTITVPNEFEPHGKFNIGITAGIETTAASAKWIEGCNRMDAVFTISEHSKRVFENSKYAFTPPGQPQQVLELKKPLEVLHNCVDTEVFGKKQPTDSALTKVLDSIPENFGFLFVGHWLRGDYGEDRKNVGMLIKLFLETFRQVKTKYEPMLILKTSSATFSILDREEILNKIEQIKSTVKLEAGQTMPAIYLLHGELTDKEMNTLYNHPKVKTHISLTKGEGFGRPLLEASLTGKPIIASGWSGHLDFLDKDRALLIGGDLRNVHPSAAWEDVLMEKASWFSPDAKDAMNAMAAAVMHHTELKNKAYDLAISNRKNFSYDAIRKQTHALLDKYVPEFPKEVPLVLPKLKKVELPKLKKVE